MLKWIALKSDTYRQTLAIDDFDCDEMTDEALTKLATSLVASLVDMKLSLESRRQITDTGFQALVDHLPDGIQQLTLDFRVTKIDDAGLEALAENHLGTIQQLTFSSARRSAKQASRPSQKASLTLRVR